MRMPRFTPWLVIVTLTAAGAAAAAGYGLTAPKRYSASAQLLVVPVSAADSTWAGLGVLQETAVRRTAAASAAVLVRSPQVADAVRAQLGVRASSAALLKKTSTHVEGASDVVDVNVDDTSAVTAAQLANGFVDALLAQRTSSFQSQLASAIRRDAQLLAGSSGRQSAELAHRLALLRSFQGQPDPTLRRASTATAPSSASWPNVPAFVATGAGIGLAAGALVALALRLLRRRKYDRPMADASQPAVEALIDRLEQRLHAREAALAARERDLQAKIDELQGLDVSGREASLAERERQLEQRIATVTKRELEVARRAAAPPPDDRRAAERERALEERERQLGERVAALTQREVELARRAAEPPPEDPRLAEREGELAQREADLDRRARELEARETELARQPEPQPVAPPAPAAEPRPVEAPAPRNGSFNLAELELLVEGRGPRYPDRLDEWRSYLFFLRDYAAPDGSLPESFDWLVQDTFRELLVR